MIIVGNLNNWRGPKLLPPKFVPWKFLTHTDTQTHRHTHTYTHTHTHSNLDDTCNTHTLVLSMFQFR